MNLRPHRQSIQQELRDKFVYDFGCAGDTEDCTSTVRCHSATARGYLGFDHNAVAVRELQQEGYDVRLYDFENPSNFNPSPECARVPAIILLNEVLEHLPNPGSALRQLRRIAVLHDSCRLLIGVPNRNSLLLNAAFWITRRDLDPEDHTCGYSVRNLSGLLHKTGWRLNRYWYFYHDVPMKKRSLMVAKIGRKLEYPLRRWIARLLPHGAPGLMVLAEPAQPSL